MTDADALEYCETLLQHFREGLSDWEDGFVRSLRDQVMAGRAPTERQAEVLDRLMETKAGGYGR